MEDDLTYYSFASDRPGYENSRLHAFHILLARYGEEGILAIEDWRYDNEINNITGSRLTGKLHSKWWTDEQKQYLTDNCLKLTPSEIAYRLGKTVNSVRCMRAHLGLPSYKKARSKKKCITATT